MLFGLEDLVETNEVTPKSSAEIIGEQVLFDLLSKDEISSISESRVELEALREMGIVEERTIVKLDKKAKLNRAYKAAVFTIARERNDRDFKKLLTLWRMERVLEDKLMKKYSQQAMKRAKDSLRNVAKSANSAKVRKSTVINRAVERAKNQITTR